MTASPIKSAKVPSEPLRVSVIFEDNRFVVKCYYNKNHGELSRVSRVERTLTWQLDWLVIHSVGHLQNPTAKGSLARDIEYLSPRRHSVVALSAKFASQQQRQRKFNLKAIKFRYGSSRRGRTFNFPSIGSHYNNITFTLHYWLAGFVLHLPNLKCIATKRGQLVKL